MNTQTKEEKSQNLILAWFSTFCNIIGQILLQTVDNETASIGSGQRTCKIKVNNNRAFWAILLRWDLGFSESFMNGDLEISEKDLLQFFLIMIEARNFSDNFSILTLIGKFGDIWKFFVNQKNSVQNSKTNISKHYDLSNDMFKLFLDSTMTYSSGFYNNYQENLEKAQKNKLNLVIEKAEIVSEDTVLEIGSGWGSFAIQVVQKTGCNLVTTTISKEQYNEAILRIKNAGLSSKISVILVDYRDLQKKLNNKKFDKIISIEMIEAVGHQFLPQYFGCLDALLKENGKIVIQAITSSDSRYNNYRKRIDFIQKYIFPGGICPSISAITNALDSGSKLKIDSFYGFGVDYAKTLSEWSINFLKNWEKIEKLISLKKNNCSSDIFKKKWLYYFKYCEAGFLKRELDVCHFIFSKKSNIENYLV